MDMTEVLRFQKAFSLPRYTEDSVLLLPVSGGADSTYLAILLHRLFPDAPFQMIFTDTGAEEPEIYVVLDKLEQYLGKPITRIKPKLDLFQLIEKQGGFLPSASQRWCTRELKLVSFRQWIAQFAGRQKFMFIGIRADEHERVAFSINEVETVLPFVDLGLSREDIFQGLRETIGVPRFYQRRSRSGCSTCPFQRRSELVGLLQDKPEEFARGMFYEKLTASDAARHDPALPLWNDTGLGSNWLSLPRPAGTQAVSGTKAKADDLFGNRGIFVGGEFFMDAMPGMEPFVWHQRVISYSQSLAGLKRQLDDRYRHLLSTSEVFDMEPEDVRRNVKFAIWYVELPGEVFDPAGPTGESYTWLKGTSYRQLRHIVQWVTRALQAEQLRQVAAFEPTSLLSVEYEWSESAKTAISEVREETGQVIDSMWYEPKEAPPTDLTEEEELSLLPCPMCHI